MSACVLVVDDDAHIREVICFALERAGLRAVQASDGAEALEMFARARADLVILDVGLPELDGLEVCRRIRKASEAPILFLSARGDEIDRVLGLELGGDDYVVKPFSPRELVARVQAILKRCTPGRPVARDRLSHGRLTLDLPRFEALFDGAPAPLTAIEFMILHALASQPGIVFSREKIMEEAYADNIHVSDRTIDSHVRNIRVKFAALGCSDAIETVHGVGFRIGPLGRNG